MKKQLILIIFIGLISCTKDLELPFEKADKTIVVNCLFTKDENWKVILTRLKSYNDQSDAFVDNAKVMVVPENNDTIRLTYTAEGVYLAEKKTVEGIQYQLLIKDGTSKPITATNSIPVTPVISDLNYSNQKTIFFSNPNLSDYNVFPLNLKISGNEQSNYVRLRFYSFNTQKGYLRYAVTQQTIWTLREKKIPEPFLKGLAPLFGKLMSRLEYGDIIKKIADEYNIPKIDFIQKVIPAISEIKVNYREKNYYLSGIILSNSNWLNNVSRDINNILGEYHGTAEANLFVDYLPVQNKNGQTDYKEEYWLEVVGMSADYYKYQKSYIKQVINQSNPFASVIEVYSNINNGVGIFAGYNRQMIHFYDY